MDSSDRDLVMGVDLGTGGARAVIVTVQGDILATASEELPRSRVHRVVNPPRPESSAEAVEISSMPAGQ